MIQHNNDKGSVIVSAAVYTEIAGTAATNCFGVKGMAARSEISRRKSLKEHFVG